MTAAYASKTPVSAAGKSVCASVALGVVVGLVVVVELGLIGSCAVAG